MLAKQKPIKGKVPEWQALHQQLAEMLHMLQVDTIIRSLHPL
jgi:hypothetical protein